MVVLFIPVCRKQTDLVRASLVCKASFRLARQGLLIPPYEHTQEEVFKQRHVSALTLTGFIDVW